MDGFTNKQNQKILALKDTIKILIVDDSEENVKSLTTFLIENGFTHPILIAKDEKTFLKHLEECLPDVIICEHELPGFNSLQALNYVKEKCPDVIFILVSTEISDEFAVELLKEGVDVYFLRHRIFQLPLAIERLCTGRRNKEEVKKLSAVNEELKRAYKEIEEKNQSITQSIIFAKRIQTLTLPKIDLLLRNFQDAFILYKPKDIVSGDFYWFRMINDRFLVAVADCTGHGVSGALLSMIGYNFLDEIVNSEENMTDPTQILMELDEHMVKLLKQDMTNGYQDGIDMSLISIDKEKQKIVFCGCKRPLLYLVRNEKKINVYKGEPYIVGGVDTRHQKTFKSQEISYKRGDTIYMLSDGYTDQFGGQENKKLMNERFSETLLSIQHLKLNYQAQLLEQKLVRWQGCNEQTDDVLVVGIKL